MLEYYEELHGEEEEQLCHCLSLYCVLGLTSAVYDGAVRPAISSSSLHCGSSGRLSAFKSCLLAPIPCC